MRIKIREYKADESILNKIKNMSREELVNEIKDMSKLYNTYSNASKLRIYLHIEGDVIDGGEGRIKISIYDDIQMVDETYYLITNSKPIIGISIDNTNLKDINRHKILKAVEDRIMKMSDFEMIDMVNDLTIRLGYKDIIKY